MLNRDRLVSYPEVAIAAWVRKEVSSSSVKCYASSLRNKLRNNGRPTFEVLNSRGIGLRLVSSGDVYRLMIGGPGLRTEGQDSLLE
jgi:DNA-binding response OmpR family regulator